MQIKGGDVIGLKVIAKDTGKFLSKVNDLIYDPNRHKVLAMIIDEGGLFSDAKVILFDDIDTIGRDAVMIQSEQLIRKTKEVPEQVANIAGGKTYLTKTKIVTEDGEELGSVSDVFFDDETGDVTEMEVSQGIKNLQSGKKKIKVADIVTIGEEATIVKTSAVQDVAQQESEQSIESRIQHARDKVETEENKQKAKTTWDSAKSRANETVSTIGNEIKQKYNQVTGKMQEDKVKSVLGKYLTVNILTSTGEMIAQRGDMITQEIIDRSREYELLDKVLANNSEEPVV